VLINDLQIETRLTFIQKTNDSQRHLVLWL